MTTWGIVGLGWLGAELAHVVEADGDRAWGTHRDTFTFGRDPFPTTKAEVILLNTPPLKDLAPADYVRAVTVADEARVIFISSTSVYGATGRHDEDSAVDPQTDSARWLCAVETALRERFGDRLSVVRPGGLIGGTRHPVFFLSKSDREIDDGAINFVHRADVIGILRALVKDPRPLVNAVAPHHPLKSKYYAEWCARENLTPVKVRPGQSVDRVIASRVAPSLYPTWICPHLDRLAP